MSALAWEPDQPTDIFFNGLSTLISVYFILKPGSLGLSRDRLKLGVQRPTVACASRGGQQSPPGTRVPSSIISSHRVLSFCTFQSRGHRCGYESRDWFRREVSASAGSLLERRGGEPVSQVWTIAVVGREVDAQGGSHPAISLLNPQGSVRKEPSWPVDSDFIS